MTCLLRLLLSPPICSEKPKVSLSAHEKIDLTDLCLDSTVCKSLALSLSDILESALSILEEKVLRQGESFNHFWFANTSSSFASALLNDRPEEAKEKVVDRITRLYYKILAFQVKQLPPVSAVQVC